MKTVPATGSPAPVTRVNAPTTHWRTVPPSGSNRAPTHSSSDKAVRELGYRLVPLEEMLRDTSQLLSRLTHYAAVVVGPPHEAARVRSVQIVGLDPFLGFFHVIEEGRPSLPLDVMEEFRPVVVDSVVLAMVEDDALPRTFSFRSPVQAIRQVSYDLTLRRPLLLQDGTTVTALEVQWELLARAGEWAERNGLDAVGGDDVGRQILTTWEEVLTGLEHDPDSLADRLDWVAKHRILTAYKERHGLEWGDGRLAALALQYHDVRPERSLSARAGLVRMTDDHEVATAMTNPPTDTRAYFRGRCLQRFPNEVVAANWDSIVFDVGQDALRRVPMMEPLRGTRAHVGTLLDESATPAELVARLGGA